jgi:hypothetical protein
MKRLVLDPEFGVRGLEFKSVIANHETKVAAHRHESPGLTHERRTSVTGIYPPEKMLLMVDSAIAGSSLGQLPFVVFSADFLAKGWIAHVQDPENKASQMREVGNAPSGSLHGCIQFYEAENDHKILRRDGDKEVDVDEAVGEKPAKCQKDSIDGAGSSDHRNKLIRGKNDRANPCSDATEQEIS